MHLYIQVITYQKTVSFGISMHAVSGLRHSGAPQSGRCMLRAPSMTTFETYKTLDTTYLL